MAYLPFIANEIWEHVMAVAFNSAPRSLTASELVPRKTPSTFRLYAGFGKTSRAFRKIALQAWFHTFVPTRLHDLEFGSGGLFEVYNLGCFVRHLYLSAVFELKSPVYLERFRNLESLSYFADPHLQFISYIPPSVRSLELRGSAHPRVELLTTIGHHLHDLTFLRITNNVESMGLRESADIDQLQEEYTRALSPLQGLEYLSLNVHLGQVPRQPFVPDGRPDNENALALLLAKLLPNLRGVEFHWETCIGTGAGEKSVFWVRLRECDGIVRLQKQFMSKVSEDSPWGLWLSACPSTEVKGRAPSSSFKFWSQSGCPRAKYLRKGARPVTQEIKG